MTSIWRPIATTLALTLVIGACAAVRPTQSEPVTITLLPGTPGPTAPSTSGAPITTSEPIPTLGEATAEIELTILGGPAEGSYRAVVHGTSCIQPSSDEFVANYADNTAADGFTALDLNVRDAPAAIDDVTSDFLLGLTVAGTTYSVDPAAGQGDGEVLLEIDPFARATLDLSATAQDGTEFELSLLCDVEAL